MKPNLHPAPPKLIKQSLPWLVLILFLLQACSLSSLPPEAINATLSALQAQQTRLAQTQQALTPQAQISNEAALAAPLPASPFPLPFQSTALPAQQPTGLTAPPPALPVVDQGEQLARQMNSAKILVFEDMSASRHLRYVKEALDRQNYFYLDVGSAKGWFKNQLLSPVEWDLVIASAEARRDFGGEFFEYLDKQVVRGASLIVEYWDWDAAPVGMQQVLLDRCGVEYEDDWFEPDMRVFFWLDPTNPILSQPNPIPSAMRNAAALWKGDLGDLFRLKKEGGRQTGDARLLAGANASLNMDHGVLVSCLQGRVILQSFSSHEYEKESVIALWQNYIYQTLANRFASLPAVEMLAPSPVQPNSALALTAPAATANLGQEAACGSILSARVTEPPHLQRALFEHHAAGTFLTVSLALKHTGAAPLQIWDQDYSLQALVGGESVEYQPHKAATGYLYINNGGNLIQDLLTPGSTWRINLAFDVDQTSQDWVLIFRPGSEVGQPVCEVRLSLAQ